MEKKVFKYVGKEVQEKATTMKIWIKTDYFTLIVNSIEKQAEGKGEEFISGLSWDHRFFSKVIVSGICEKFPGCCNTPKCIITQRVYELAKQKTVLTITDIRSCLNKVLSFPLGDKPDDLAFQNFYVLLLNHLLCRSLYRKYQFQKQENVKTHMRQFSEFRDAVGISCDFMLTRSKDMHQALLLDYIHFAATCFARMNYPDLYVVLCTIQRGLVVLCSLDYPQSFHPYFRLIHFALEDLFDSMCESAGNFEGNWIKRMPVKDFVGRMMLEKEMVGLAGDIRERLASLDGEYEAYWPGSGLDSKKLRGKIGKFCNFCLKRVSCKSTEVAISCSRCRTARYCSTRCCQLDERHGSTCQYFDAHKLLEERFERKTAGMKCKVCRVRKEKYFECSRCKDVVYCSKECQIVDWKNEHKKICKK